MSMKMDKSIYGPIYKAYFNTLFYCMMLKRICASMRESSTAHGLNQLFEAAL